MATSQLKKNVGYIVTAGTAGSQGTQPVPRTVYTVQQPYEVWTVINGSPPVDYDPTKYIRVPLNTNDGLGGYSWSKYEVKYTSKTVVYPGSAGIPPVPPTPPTVTETINKGWDGSANSIDSINEGAFNFTFINGVAAVAGLTSVDTTTSYTDIEYGFYFNDGYVSVVESGVISSVKYDYDIPYESKELRIQKDSFGVVKYFLRGSIVHTSTKLSDKTLFASASLFTSADGVIDPYFSPAYNYVRTIDNDFIYQEEAPDYSTTFYAYDSIVGTLSSVEGQIVTDFVDQIYGEMKALDGSIASQSSGLVDEIITEVPNTKNFLDFTLPQLQGLIISKEIPKSVIRADIHPVIGIVADFDYSIIDTQLPEMIGFIADNSVAMFYEGLSLDVDINLFELEAAIENPQIQGLDAFLPSFELVAYGSDEVSSFLPAFDLEAEGYTVQTLQMDVLLKSMFTLEAEMNTGSVLEMDAFLPTFELETDSGNFVDSFLPTFELEAEATHGTTMQMDAFIPLFTLESEGLWSELSMDALLPLLEMGEPSMEMDAFLPLFDSQLFARQAQAVRKEDYLGYAINLDTVISGRSEIKYQTTNYTNFAYNQIVKYKGKYYGVNASGIFELDGETDDGQNIDWKFRSHLSDFDTRNIKTLRYAYIRGRVQGDYDMVVQESENQDDMYYIPQIGPKTPSNSRAKLGRGVRAEYFGVGMQGSSPIEIDALEIDVDISTRGVK